MNELDRWNQDMRESECRKHPDCTDCPYESRCVDGELTNDIEEI